MVEIHNGSNFFNSLYTALSREQVAGLYGALGWRVRKSSWMNYEVFSDWAEMVIEAECPILMHGLVADLVARAEELVAPLRAAGVAFTAECYRSWPDGELLLELRSYRRTRATNDEANCVPAQRVGMRATAIFFLGERPA